MTMLSRADLSRWALACLRRRPAWRYFHPASGCRPRFAFRTALGLGRHGSPSDEPPPVSLDGIGERPDVARATIIARAHVGSRRN